MIRLLLGLLALSTATTQPDKPDIAGQLETLRQMQISDAGRGPLVEAYEKLIAAAGDDPRAADAMMDLASLWEARIPEKHVQPDAAEALKWYRKAAAAADKQSPAWARSRFAIVWRTEWDDPAQARRILTEIAAGTKADPVSQAQVENTLITVCLRENKLDEAETHARNVLGWYDTSGRTPTDAHVKDAIDSVMASAAMSIIDAITPATLPLDTRISRIKQLMDDYPNIAALQDDGADAIKQLQNTRQAGVN